jgi:hypothetical protein
MENFRFKFHLQSIKITELSQDPHQFIEQILLKIFVLPEEIINQLQT